MNALQGQGYAVSATQMAARPKTVPDSQNLSLAVMEAAALLDKRSTPPKIPPRGEMPSLENASVSRGYLTNNVAAFGMGAEILRRNEGLLDLDYSEGYRLLLPHLSKFRKLARAYSTKVLVASADHRAHEAAKDLLTVFQIARALEEEPTMVSQLTRFSVLGSGCLSLDHALNSVEFRAEDLVELQAALNRLGGLTRMDMAFASELVFAHDLFNREPEMMLRVMLAPDEKVGLGMKLWFWTYSSIGFLKSDHANHVGMLSELIGIARLPSWEQSVPLTNWVARTEALCPSLRPGKMWGWVLLGPTAKSCRKEWRNLAIVRCAAVAVAIERYRLDHERKPPENLDTLVPRYLSDVPVDPYDGKPLRFRQETGGWTVYSIGPNLRDDHGREEVKNRRRDDADLIFTVKR